MGLFVEAAATNDAALVVLRDPEEAISVVISDIDRGISTYGLALLDDLQALPIQPPVIFYVAQVDAKRGVPPRAFGITNRPDELMNLVMDAIDRLPDRSQA